MEDTIILPVTTQTGCETVAALAGEIWREHYTPIIGAEQVEYMLEHFQTAECVAQDINENGYAYFILMCAGAPCGYSAVQPRGEELFLSKIYVRAARRGGGYGRLLMEHSIREGSGLCANAAKRVTLTVNRNNTGSIEVYKKMGFSIARTQCADIGGGYVMDDYVMQREIIDI